MAEWKAPLCGCFDNIGLCLFTYFLPCVIAGQNAEAVGQGPCLNYAIFSLLGCIGIYCMAKTREAVREKYGIEGSFGNDIIMSWCCGFCSVIQVARELDITPSITVQAISRV